MRSGEASLIWFEGVPVVVGDEPMAAGLFLCHYAQSIIYLIHNYANVAQIKIDKFRIMV